MDFKQLKSASGKSGLASLTQELAKLNTYADADPRFWRPTTDKAGNGYAVIRFLPAPENEDIPFIRQFRHDFKGPTGGVYRELSLTTLGQNDPCGEYNTKLWNTGLESDKTQARVQKRKLSFISNILVVNDAGSPENNNKVFLFKYGVKIFDKVQAKLSPEFEGEEGYNPYDFWEGANFKLRIKKVQDFPNYDDSEFMAQSKLYNGEDEKLETLWKSQYSLKELNDPKHFKSYDELKTLLHRVLGHDSVATQKHEETRHEAETPPTIKTREAPAQAESQGVPFDADEGEDMTAYFRKLAQ